MKVLIAGATGVLGRRLVQQLRDRNHSAIALVRSAFMRTDRSTSWSIVNLTYIQLGEASTEVLVDIGVETSAYMLEILVLPYPPALVMQPLL
jgi:NAD dependent epimerase/dehydratase family enzyme